MIALDTNILVRMLVEDDPDQAEKVQKTIRWAEKQAVKLLVLSEVTIETVWVLESVYQCTREEIVRFLKKIIDTDTFVFPDFSVIMNAIDFYKTKGDFADFIIVGQSRVQQAEQMLSFDKKLQKRFPEYVVETPSGFNDTDESNP